MAERRTAWTVVVSGGPLGEDSLCRADLRTADACLDSLPAQGTDLSAPRRRTQEARKPRYAGSVAANSSSAVKSGGSRPRRGSTWCRSAGAEWWAAT